MKTPIQDLIAAAESATELLNEHYAAVHMFDHGEADTIRQVTDALFDAGMRSDKCHTAMVNAHHALVAAQAVLGDFSRDGKLGQQDEDVYVQVREVVCGLEQCFNAASSDNPGCDKCGVNEAVEAGPEGLVCNACAETRQTQDSGPHKCPFCGANNHIVNQCRCDHDNLPTKVP